MKERDIIKQIAQQEGVSPKQVKQEMLAALRSAGLACSVDEFIEFALLLAQKGRNIV